MTILLALFFLACGGGFSQSTLAQLEDLLRQEKYAEAAQLSGELLEGKTP